MLNGRRDLRGSATRMNRNAVIRTSTRNMGTPFELHAVLRTRPELSVTAVTSVLQSARSEMRSSMYVSFQHAASEPVSIRNT